MITVRDLILMGEVASCSPDGTHWEPSLPIVGYRPLRDRLGDAWAVWTGRAYAVRQTEKRDLPQEARPVEPECVHRSGGPASECGLCEDEGLWPPQEAR